jgi:D-beta-D-heptose 7-phosphate kinase/D-beta-D-heptose 1-phosphate adenosyltransferase
MPVIALETARSWRAELRANGERLVFTNGHFDLLHIGHLDYLEKAAALGDVLFVGVNGDASTRRLKGEGRPLVPAVERARLLAALQPVDAVLIFDHPSDTASALIAALQPEIYVKGGDYAVGPSAEGAGEGHPVKPLPERATVEAYGGRVVLIDYLPDHSTSALIARVRALP